MAKRYGKVRWSLLGFESWIESVVFPLVLSAGGDYEAPRSQEPGSRCAVLRRCCKVGVTACLR